MSEVFSLIPSFYLRNGILTTQMKDNWMHISSQAVMAIFKTLNAVHIEGDPETRVTRCDISSSYNVKVRPGLEL